MNGHAVSRGDAFRAKQCDDEQAKMSGHGHRPADMEARPSNTGFVRRTFLIQSGKAALLATSTLGLPMTEISIAQIDDPPREIALQDPDQAGRLTLEATLAKRRSVREFSQGSLTPAEISQLLWAGQGITSQAGYRTAPSAGALYPLGPVDIYLSQRTMAASVTTAR